MDLKAKVTDALRRYFRPEHIRLEDDDGISGFVVSSQFQKLSSLNRQKLISTALRDSANKFTKAELRHVILIAGLTPVEYDALGYNEKRSRR